MNTDDYAKKQAKKDAEYEREYEAWVKSMTLEERREAEKLGLLKPCLQRHGNGAAEHDMAESSRRPARFIEPHDSRKPNPMTTLTATSNHKFTIDRSGIIFNEELTFEEWRDLGMELAPVAKTIGFIVGDWINYGESRYGEKYADAMRMTGLAYDTLRKYAHAARSIQIGNRFPNLDWTHHLAVAKVKDQEEQRKWLELADTDGMSVKRLKMSINAGRPLKPDEVDKDNADRGTVTHLSLINQILRWWKRTTAEDPVDQWDSEQRRNVKKDFARLMDIYDSL